MDGFSRAVAAELGGVTVDTLENWDRRGFLKTASLGAIVAPLRPERRNEMELWPQWFEIGWLAEDGQLARVGRGANSPAAVRLFHELQRRRRPCNCSRTTIS